MDGWMDVKSKKMHFSRINENKFFVCLMTTSKRTKSDRNYSPKIFYEHNTDGKKHIRM